MARVTARDVARAAGVSQATVSFVLNERADQSISESTRRAVLDAVRSLGYVPSGAARSLRSGQSNVVLCVIPDIPVSPAMEEFRRALSRVLAASGLTCVFLHAEGDIALAELWPHVHPAVVLAFGPLDPTDAAHITRTGIVLVDDLLGTAGVSLTGLDQALVGELQVRHLAARGHVRIGFGGVEDPRENVFCAPRLRGAERACRELGLPEPVVASLDYAAGSGRAAIGRWTAEGITAVAAFNDLVGLTVLAGAREAGIAVPADLAVIGVDDLSVASLTSPRLTTVAWETEVPSTALAAWILKAVDRPAPPTSAGEPIRLVQGGTT